MLQGLDKKVEQAFETCFGVQLEGEVQFQETRKDFEGDFTIVVFPFVRTLKTKPEEIGRLLGERLVEDVAELSKFNVVKGFLNISFTDEYWMEWLRDLPKLSKRIPEVNSKSEVMVEYSSPNTNKPLHLGHIRNNLLGYSVSEILKANGHKVYKTQVINDRGIHICKSMLAWLRFGDGETPQSSGLKGDKLVGKYYVAFDKAYKKEIQQLIEEGSSEEDAKKNAPILLEAQEMLRKWEAKDDEVYALWSKMNGWVYEGFDHTYKRMGVDFDKLYYESVTYLTGKDHVLEGLEKGIFYQKEDQSIWCDLEAEKLDQKLVLRADGTSVYMTQDIGTALLRVKDYPKINQLIYTVGNEQDYHFKVLFSILDKLGFDWAKNCYHLSYGMVDLPSGKMKSREGTVVDADDLMQEMFDKAKETTEALGKLDELNEADKTVLYESIGQAALKYFMLKVDPKKRMLFNPEESIDFNGNTGPFIQYTYARINAILRRGGELDQFSTKALDLHEKEKSVLKSLDKLPAILDEAATQYSPAVICNYVYDLVKTYNSFYQAVPIFNSDNANVEQFRLKLSAEVGETVQFCLSLLGVTAPKRM